MGPRQYVSYSPTANLLSSSRGTEFCKHKSKRKYQLAVEKCGWSKNRLSAVTFQKKLYTEDQMHQILLQGPADKDIIMRGLLPQISVSATEKEVRNEICEVMQICESNCLGTIYNNLCMPFLNGK